MKLRSLFALVLAAATLSAPVVASAQDVPPQEDEQAYELLLERLDISNHPEVQLTVSVPNELVGLDRDAVQFTVREAGLVRPVTISEVPTDNIAVVLIIDTSGSMEGAPIEEAKDAALAFLEEMPFGTQAALVTFGSGATLVTEFTSDAGELASAIRGISTGGNTALYDGLALGLDQFETLDETRNTVVLLSDGADTASSGTLEAMEERLALIDVSYHAIELAGTENDPESMRALAEAAEGRVVAADDPSALAGVLDGLAKAIVNQYQLSFSSLTGGTSELEVVATANGEAAGLLGLVEYPFVIATTTVPPTTLASTATPTTVSVEESVVAAPLPLREGREIVLGFFASNTVLYIGLGMLFAAIAATILFTGIGQPKNVQLAAKAVGKKFGETKGKTLSSIADQATMFADRTLEKGERRGSVNNKLEEAGLSWRPAEFLVMTVASMIGAMAVGIVFIGATAGLGLAIVTALGIYAFLSSKASKRRSAFGAQLPDALQLMAGSLRSGFGLMQAVDTVSNEIADPAGEEFRRVKVETHLGRDSDEALKAMATRLGSEDFRWVVEAIEIHREVGGDLGEILDQVTDTVRDRNRIRRRVKSLSAEGRFSGIILGSLPVFLVGALMAINPEYLLELFDSTIGQVMVGGGILAMIIGVLWMRKITQLEY